MDVESALGTPNVGRGTLTTCRIKQQFYHLAAGASIAVDVLRRAGWQGKLPSR